MRDTSESGWFEISRDARVGHHRHCLRVSTNAQRQRDDRTNLIGGVMKAEEQEEMNQSSACVCA
jgi:hypothetical protein